MELFAAENISYLNQILKSNYKRMPSRWTFAAILSIIKKEELIALLPQLLIEVINKSISSDDSNYIYKDENIKINDIYNFDGKEITKSAYREITGKTGMDLKNFNAVNVFSTKCGLAIELEMVPEKKNENEAINRLIDKLDIKNVICTSDALNTQVKVVDKIIEKEGHYVLALKKNQPGTYEDWERYFEEKEFLKKIKLQKNYFIENSKDTYYTYKNEFYITEDIEWFEDKKWKNLKSVGYLEQTRTDKKIFRNKKILYY